MGYIHQITNFENGKNGDIIILSISDNNINNLSINGTADIKINGIIIWNDAGISITIDTDDKDTENHFGNQQVYGIVNRLIVM